MYVVLLCYMLNVLACMHHSTLLGLAVPRLPAHLTCALIGEPPRSFLSRFLRGTVGPKVNGFREETSCSTTT